jgi:hypothetical protein
MRSVGRKASIGLAFRTVCSVGIPHWRRGKGGRVRRQREEARERKRGGEGEGGQGAGGRRWAWPGALLEHRFIGRGMG